MQKKILKQVVGIDVAQKELVIQLGRVNEDLSTQLYASNTLPNTARGFHMLIKWVQKLTDRSVPVRFVMEATGVYHESLAYFLEGAGHQVSIRSVIISAPWTRKPLQMPRVQMRSADLVWKEVLISGNVQNPYLKDSGN